MKIKTSVSTLRTLNDLGKTKRECCSIVEGQNNICEMCIKAEAIKWIKEDRGQIEADKRMPQPTRMLLNHLTRKWMDRLNITSEDLK